MGLLRRYTARDEVLSAALRVLSAGLAPDDDPNRAAEIELADELLDLSARNLTRAIEAAEPQSWPVGWATSPMID